MSTLFVIILIAMPVSTVIWRNIREEHFQNIMKERFPDYYKRGYSLIIRDCLAYRRIKNTELRAIHRQYTFEVLAIMFFWYSLLFIIFYF
jgi:hypothetical protein